MPFEQFVFNTTIGIWLLQAGNIGRQPSFMRIATSCHFKGLIGTPAKHFRSVAFRTQRQPHTAGNRARPCGAEHLTKRTQFRPTWFRLPHPPGSSGEPAQLDSRHAHRPTVHAGSDMRTAPSIEGEQDLADLAP